MVGRRVRFAKRRYGSNRASIKPLNPRFITPPFMTAPRTAEASPVGFFISSIKGFNSGGTFPIFSMASIVGLSICEDFLPRISRMISNPKPIVPAAQPLILSFQASDRLSIQLLKRSPGAAILYLPPKNQSVNRFQIYSTGLSKKSLTLSLQSVQPSQRSSRIEKALSMRPWISSSQD